nr:leucine-rich repeat domain-containing protein [Pseudomonas sp. BIGb0427]
MRNRGADYRLLLEHEPIGALPQLPESISFAHVAEITLNDLQITDLPPGFLQRFSALRWLDVVHGDLARVPEGIDGLNHLTWLNLSHNRIAWTLPTIVCWHRWAAWRCSTWITIRWRPRRM